MRDFAGLWFEAARTTLGLFWMALWAFALGYFISSLIQVLVTRKRMRSAMGESGPRSVGIGAFFGFISSSCSFAALSTTRVLFQKGAGLVPSLAFMLASTNLVVELGIVIALFLGWQFVVGEYVGGILLILLAWLFVRLTRPTKLVEEARRHLDDHHAEEDEETGDWKDKVSSSEGWRQIGSTYVMEWQMVWKDVLIGFTVAGIIAAFVPDSFFATLFVGSGGGSSSDLGFFAVLAQALVGPVAAFFTFIGSMGNIPLAAILFDRGVSFAGVMAFIFSDLVVLPVLRINMEYYGRRMALYLLGLMLACLVITSLVLHYSFAAFGLLPEAAGDSPITGMEMFALDHGFVLNVVFLALSAVLAVLWWRQRAAMHEGHDHDHGGGEVSWTDRILRTLSAVAALWLIGGLVVGGLVGR